MRVCIVRAACIEMLSSDVNKDHQHQGQPGS